MSPAFWSLTFFYRRASLDVGMSNDIKSQPQPAPAALVRSPHSVNISQRADAPSRVGAANGSNVAQVFRPEVFDFSERVAAPELSPQLMSQPRKFAYPSLTKYKWSRPLLIDSVLPTEFDVPCSKQTTDKFLTGARTHISDFRKLPNLGPVLFRKKSSKRLGLRSLQHAQLPHRSQRPSRSRRHRPHRRLIVKLLGRKIGNHPRLNRRINFFDPRLDCPLALKIQNLFNLFKRHAVIPPVAIFHPHNFRPRYHARNRRPQLLDLQVQRRRPHIKNLARNRARLRLQTRHHRARRILHMQKWTPLLPIQNRNLPGGRRPRHK